MSFDMDDRKIIVKDEEQGYVERMVYPFPEGCNGTKITKAFQKLANVRPPIRTTDAALLPLTPMEKGFVLGALAEYHARRA